MYFEATLSNVNRPAFVQPLALADVSLCSLSDHGIVYHIKKPLISLSEIMQISHYELFTREIVLHTMRRFFNSLKNIPVSHCSLVEPLY